MTNAEKAQKEWENVREWVLDEEDRVTERLKKEGQYVPGLDSNTKHYAYIYQERNKRLKEIKEKYGLVKSTVI